MHINFINETAASYIKKYHFKKKKKIVCLYLAKNILNILCMNKIEKMVILFS